VPDPAFPEVQKDQMTATAPSASPAPIADLSFEQALAELEAIVRALESGQSPLEQSIEQYERGAALKAHCEAKLAAARLRVEKIVVGAGGATTLSPAEFN
jgi:exodeoxyribonuclease VII small subunit